MDLKSAKYDIIEQLMQLEDSDLLAEIRQLIEQRQQDSAVDKEERAAVEAGIAQAEQGKVKGHGQVMAETRAKYPQLFGQRS